MDALGPIFAAGEYLQKWQTLLAALVALFAARRAYAAAMAKVDFDRETAEQALISKKLALFLRLHSAIEIYALQLQHVLERLPEEGDAEGRGTVLEQADVPVLAFPEVDEAWESLDLFPSATFIPLKMLRASVRVLQSFPTDFLEPGDILEIPSFEDMPIQLQQLRTLCETASEHAAEIAQHLERSIEQFRLHKRFS